MKTLATVALVAALAGDARAFCGFYINGSGSEMFNNATQVVLMRSGTRTVLSMQNTYQGPTEDFAMVVPVPVVLHDGDVKTLPAAVFDRVDTMGAPRLVEYWEQDPCPKPVDLDDEFGAGNRQYRKMPMPKMASKTPDTYQVTIEAQFTVGEYQVVILSAKDSTGLDAYLRDQKYKIPQGAEPLLRPYVENGSKFFVAKVDPTKVRYENGRVMLSPLRFHYDSDELTLPIRLGLANSAGKQDLIVSILAPSQRYELANYPNVVIPTNFDVTNDVRERFGEFYASLFDRTLQKNPGAIVTEYAWDASTCDPCPGPPLSQADMLTLGADLDGPSSRTRFVLTRLHARYGAADAKDDLVFRAAQAISGGRERYTNNQLEHGAVQASINNFQGRYAIRHPWTGEVACKNPRRGVWGGPPGGGRPTGIAATETAFAPRGAFKLWDVIAADIPEIDVKRGVGYMLPVEPAARAPRTAAELAPTAPVAAPPATNPAVVTDRPCGCTSGPLDPSSAAGLLALVGGVALGLGRRRRLTS